MAITRTHDFFLQWHLTQRCNLSCRHCYQEPDSGGEMDLAEARDVVAELVETLDIWRQAYGLEFNPSCNLTGGEPLLREDLFAVIGELRARGVAVFLLTNGLLADAKRAERLAELGVAGVQVSLEGPRRVHDEVRGKGSFDASLRGVENLLAAGHTVTLNVTLSAHNAGSFLELTELARSLGVQRLGFSRLVPVGRGRQMLDQALSRAQVRDLYRRILALDPPGLELVTGDPLAAQASVPLGEDLGDIPLGGCAAGTAGLTLLPDGTVLPCRRLPIPLGNLRQDSLREIWAGSPALAALRERSRYQDRCRRCPRWAACRGCRAIAHAHGGDPLAEDPACFLGPE